MHTCNNNYLIHSETCIHRFLRDQGNEKAKVAKYKLWENFVCQKHKKTKQWEKLYISQVGLQNNDQINS